MLMDYLGKGIVSDFFVCKEKSASGLQRDLLALPGCYLHLKMLKKSRPRFKYEAGSAHQINHPEAGPLFKNAAA